MSQPHDKEIPPPPREGLGVEIQDNSQFTQHISPSLDVYSSSHHPLSPKTSISLDRPDFEHSSVPPSPKYDSLAEGAGLASPGLPPKRASSRPSSFLFRASSPTPSRRTSGASQQGGVTLGLSLTSNSNFYEIPIVRIFSPAIHLLSLPR